VCTASNGGICILIVSGAAIVTHDYHTQNITVCNYEMIESGSMEVLDTSQNIYYISDFVTQTKIENGKGKTFNVNIEYEWNTNIITSINEPLTCGNQTCGV